MEGGDMRAMVLHRTGPAETSPLVAERRAIPSPGPDELLVRVQRCGVCRTDLHVVEGDLPPRRATVVPGHEIVGRVERTGARVTTIAPGATVGIPWLHATCGVCEYCRSERENLCTAKEFTGYSVDGGYAEYAVASAAYTLPLGEGDPARWAPFLCAGIIGFRALKLAFPRAGGRIGFFGFGGSAHLALQLADRMGYATVAYSRSADHLALAARLGATETVLTTHPGAVRTGTLDAAVVFAPRGEVVVDALRATKKGGTVSVSAIHLSTIPALDYDRDLFGERRLVSTEANTREDAREFLELARLYHLESTVTERPLAEANEALTDLKQGRVTGAVVLDCTSP